MESRRGEVRIVVRTFCHGRTKPFLMGASIFMIGDKNVHFTLQMLVWSWEDHDVEQSQLPFNGEQG